MTTKQNKKVEYETVTVKVPKKLMQLIKAQNYFSRTPEKFFADCVRSGVSGDMSRLDYDEEQRLTRKYQVESELWVDSDKHTL